MNNEEKILSEQEASDQNTSGEKKLSKGALIGIIGGAVAVFLVSKFKKKNFFTIADSLMPGVMLGQLIGRWGNFMNGEAFGGETTLPWRMRLCNKLTDYQVKEVHPTFLYESLWNLLGFVLINFFYKKKKFNGQIACMYLTWYGLGRFFIEGLRTDSLYIPGTAIRTSQLVGAICFIVFGGLLVAGLIYARKFNDPDARLSKFDEVIKPSLDMNPIFIEKKAKVCVSDVANENEEKKEE